MEKLIEQQVIEANCTIIANAKILSQKENQIPEKLEQKPVIYNSIPWHLGIGEEDYEYEY